MGSSHMTTGTLLQAGPTAVAVARETGRWRSLTLGAVLAGAVMAMPAEAPADNKVCYWNAEGLPYSKAPPPDAGEALFPGGPMQALFAIHMEAPQLVFKAACGIIEDADLARPREVYRRWLGCSPDSSMAEMIEGLESGGVFVSESMSFLEYASGKYAAEFAEHCPLLKGIDPICFRASGAFPKDVERYPQCVEAWPKIETFTEFVLEIREHEKAVANELSRQDRALIESAEVK